MPALYDAGESKMMWPPPLPVRLPGWEDYTSLGQDEHPLLWVPALVGLAVFLALLIVATITGRI
jgi:hypothetical protein